MDIIKAYIKQYYEQDLVDPLVVLSGQQLESRNELDPPILKKFLKLNCLRTFEKLDKELKTVNHKKLRKNHRLMQENYDSHERETFQDDDDLQETFVETIQVKPLHKLLKVVPENDVFSHSPESNRKKSSFSEKRVDSCDVFAVNEQKKKKKRKSRENEPETVDEPSSSGNLNSCTNPLTEIFLKFLDHLESLGTEQKRQLEAEILGLLSNRLNTNSESESNPKTKKKKKKKKKCEVIDLSDDSADTSRKRRHNADIIEEHHSRKKTKKRHNEENIDTSQNESENVRQRKSVEQPWDARDGEGVAFESSHTVNDVEYENVSEGPRGESNVFNDRIATDSVKQFRRPHPRLDHDTSYEINSETDSHSEDEALTVLYQTGHLSANEVKSEPLGDAARSANSSQPEVPHQKSKKNRLSRKEIPQNESISLSDSGLEPRQNAEREANPVHPPVSEEPPQRGKKNKAPNKEILKDERIDLSETDQLGQNFSGTQGSDHPNPESDPVRSALLDDPRALEKELLELEHVLVSADKDGRQKSTTFKDSVEITSPSCSSSAPISHDPDHEEKPEDLVAESEDIIVEEKVEKKIQCHKCGEKFLTIQDMFQHWTMHVKESLLQHAPAPETAGRSPDKPTQNLPDICPAPPKTRQPQNRRPTQLLKRRVNNSNVTTLKTTNVKTTRRAEPVATPQTQKQPIVKTQNQTASNSSASAFKCTVCQIIFKTQALLSSHMEKHARPFKCSLCNTSFKSDSTLKRHNLVQHSSKRPYKCPNCPKVFKRESAVNFHLSSIHHLKRFKCNLCQVEFRFRRTLIEHKKIVHPAGSPTIPQNST